MSYAVLTYVDDRKLVLRNRHTSLGGYTINTYQKLQLHNKEAALIKYENGLFFAFINSMKRVSLHQFFG